MLIFNGLGDVGLLVLRVFLGLVFFVHAVPKLKMPKAMAKGMGKPPGMFVMLGLVEILASLALIFGIFAEIGALLVGLVMLGALYYKMFVWKLPFVSMEKSGWELDLMLLGAAVVVLSFGAGNISLDAVLGFWP